MLDARAIGDDEFERDVIWKREEEEKGKEG